MGKPFVAVPKSGSIDPSIVVELGAKGVRLTIDRRDNQPVYLQGCLDRGLETCLTADTDTFWTVDWSAVRANPDDESLYVDAVSAEIAVYAAQYRGLMTYLQAWNEFDGEGAESSTMPVQVVNRVTRMWRAAFPRPQYLISASSVSGQPSALTGLELDDCDGVDLHLYATAPASWPDPMTGRFADKLQAYIDVLPERFNTGGRIHMTEFGLSSWPDEGNANSETPESRELQRAYCEAACSELFPDERLGIVSWFALHNWAGFGLLDLSGGRKETFNAYTAAAPLAKWVDDVEPPAEPPSEPQDTNPSFTLGFRDLALDLGAAVVGAPLEQQHGWDSTGGNHVEVQETDRGLMFWTRRGNRCMFLPSAVGASDGGGATPPPSGDGGDSGPDDPVVPVVDPPKTGLALGFDVASYQGELDGSWCEDRKHEGGEFAIVRHYLTFERAGLRDLSRRQIRNVLAGGMRVGPYAWGYRSSDPIRTINETLELAAAEYGTPPVLWLDCETYTDGAGNVVDPGPDRAWLWSFVNECTRIGQPAGLYTGAWWWLKYLQNSTEFWQVYLWYSNYGQNLGTLQGATLDAWDAEGFGGWNREYVVGKQFTSKWLGMSLDANVLDRSVVG